MPAQQFYIAAPGDIDARLIASLPDEGPVVMVNPLRLRGREAYRR